MSDSPKHIAICSTSLHEYDRRLIRITKTIRELGHKVTWISRAQNEPDIQDRPDLVYHDIIRTRFKSGPLFYLEYNLRLISRLKSIKPEIVCAVDLDTLAACYYGSKKSTLYFDAHEIFYEVPELIGKKLKKAIWKWIASSYIPKVSKAYTVNHSLKVHYERKYRVEFKVVRNVPELDSQSNPVAQQTKKTLVYLGVLNKGRGVELAIEAMKALPEYHLKIIGEGDLSEVLRAQASGLKNVSFLGYLKPSSILNELQQASIGLNLLQAESLNYKLSLANKYFDYIHAGIPSINMAYPEYEILNSEYETGILVEDYSLGSLIDGIRLLEDMHLYSRLASNTSQARIQYNWAHEKKILARIYDDNLN